MNYHNFYANAYIFILKYIILIKFEIICYDFYVKYFGTLLILFW